MKQNRQEMGPIWVLIFCAARDEYWISRLDGTISLQWLFMFIMVPNLPDLILRRIKILEF